MKNLMIFFIFILSSFFLFSCSKFIELDAPVNSTSDENVYKDDLTAAAVLTGIYTTMSGNSNSTSNINFWTGVSADELNLFDFQNSQYINYFQNKLSSNGAYDVVIWTLTYPLIYRCNEAIEGLTNSKTLSSNVKQQLLGEAKFMRAYFYFQLVNLYGGVPLALTSDYKVNSRLSRSSIQSVYNQIIMDLKDAQNLLASNYTTSAGTGNTSERVRPNKYVATALLSKVYLFNSQYDMAELQATTIIDNKSLYDTVRLDSVFLKNSKETIWSLQPVNQGENTQDGLMFILPTTGPSASKPLYLSDSIVYSFESGDKRKLNWIGTSTSGGKVYYYPYKYKIGVRNQQVNEYFIVFRLAEQYLIRAEARANLNKLSESQSDLNLIRRRASLGSTSASTQTGLIGAILKERKVELFSEGHRWLDLKRTGNVNQVMVKVTPLKGGSWKSEWQWYPIPNSEILVNDNLTQNNGYEN